MKPIQPKGNAPISKEVVEVVKRKFAPPKGPPPAGMVNFHAPKIYHPDNDTQSEKMEYDSYDENDDQYDENSNKLDNSELDDSADGIKYGNRNNNPRFNNNKEYIDESNDQQEEVDDDETSIDENRENKKYFKSDRGNVDDNVAHSDAKNSKIEKSFTEKSYENKISNSSSNQPLLFQFEPILKSTYRELRNYVLSPCDRGVTTRCYIERNRTGTNMLAPFYSVCADLGGEV
jgi:hypothetical protein